MPQSFTRDPQSVLDYSVNWLTWLDGDTIVTSTWAADPADGVVIDSDNHGATSTTVWLSGGTLGSIARLTNHVVTALGREDDRTLKFYVGDK